MLKILFEGMDKAGKSTIALIIKQAIISHDIIDYVNAVNAVKTCAVPKDDDFEVFTESWYKASAAYYISLFAKQNCEIKDFANDYCDYCNFVLFDRHLPSTIVFQGKGLPEREQYIRELAEQRRATCEMDLTFLLEISYETHVKRCEQTKNEPFSEEEFKLYSGIYQRLAKEGNWIVINAEDDLETVCDIVKEHIKACILQKAKLESVQSQKCTKNNDLSEIFDLVRKPFVTTKLDDKFIKSYMNCSNVKELEDKARNEEILEEITDSKVNILAAIAMLGADFARRFDEIDEMLLRLEEQKQLIREALRDLKDLRKHD